MGKRKGTVEDMEIENIFITSSFWKNKKVLVTGHTGFKGTWLCEMLIMLGADVYGYALECTESLSAFNILNTESRMHSYIGDVRNYDMFYNTILEIQPEIIFHLAAQPIVKKSYRNPVYTYETNVMGTVNLMECIRKTECIKSVVNVTTDKVYDNKEWCWGYRETDTLDGFDPYSNSKSCSELVTHSYIRSFFNNQSTAVSTARAGNVIGGGDFAADRIIPDCVRSAINNEVIDIRNPYSVRPYQHVVEPLSAYIMIAEKQYIDRKYSGCYNIGPDIKNCVTTGTVADIFCAEWGNASWENVSEKNAFHEANFLKLDCSKINSVFGWKPVLDINKAVNNTVEWYKGYFEGKNVRKITVTQINKYWEINDGQRYI